MTNYVVKLADAEKIKELCDSSAFTFEGLLADDENLSALSDCIKKEFPNANFPLEIYKWDGELFNRLYGLTGSNTYNGDLTFVSLPLSNWDKESMGKLAMFKMQVGARWLDDICQNNDCRENGYNEEDEG